MMKELRAVMMAFYSRATDRSGDDLVLLKERIKDINGKETVNIRQIENYKRPFYITKTAHRKTHVKKKECEDLANLDEHFSTQANLAKQAGKALGMRGGYIGLRDVKASPYFYGADISTTSIIRKQYMERYPGYAPAATVAALDLETNVFSDRGEIIYGCITMGDKALLVVTEDYIKGVEDPEAKLQTMFEEHLGKYKKERNIDLIVKVAKDDLYLVKLLMFSLHRLKPDFVSIWNMSFDVGRILDCLEHYKVDPKYIFSDPDVPERFKRFNYREDQLQKTTATGKVTSKHVADLWHVVDAPASFYIIDSMCFFKRNRVREANRNSYALDAILDEELGLEKLKFKEADHLTGLEWHKFMQSKYPIEYGIYNVFDCIALELLNEKTGDLSKSVLAMAEITDLQNIASGPKKLSNSLHFFLKDRGRIIATTSSDMTDPDLDHNLLGMTNWISTAPSELIADTGNRYIEDMSELESRIYTDAFDVDIASGYPTTEVIMNISMETTLREVCAVQGMSVDEQRRLGVNLTGIRNNAIDLGQGYYGLPGLKDLLSEYKATL